MAATGRGVAARALGRFTACALLASLALVLYLGGTLVHYRRVSEELAAEMDASARPAGGVLMIVGGGDLPDSARDRFLELAGGRKARLVVIPTASESAERPGHGLGAWARFPMASLTRLHALTRDEADDPEFARPIAESTAVWFVGGDQGRLSERYADTEVERQIQALLDRGGVVGGTSAGASIMSRVMMALGRHDEAILGRGLDLLPGVVIDQHFLRRNRMGRLSDALRKHPDLIGLGIDERTALVVDLRARRARVLGESYVVACVPTEDGLGIPRLEILKPGDEADLDALRTPDVPAIAAALDLDLDR